MLRPKRFGESRPRSADGRVHRCARCCCFYINSYSDVYRDQTATRVIRRSRCPSDPARKASPMNLNDLVLVSVDDHVVEPPDIFDGRLPAKSREYAPECITNA